MTRYSYIIDPSIDSELEFRVPVLDFDNEIRFNFNTEELKHFLDAIDLYYEYRILSLSGLTNDTSEEWIHKQLKK